MGPKGQNISAKIECLDFFARPRYLPVRRSCLPKLVTALNPLTTNFRSNIDTRAPLLRQEWPFSVND